MSFASDYRKADTNVNVTATAQQAVVCTEEQRQRLIEQREKLLAERAMS